jgi:hypothetical protein
MENKALSKYKKTDVVRILKEKYYVNRNYIDRPAHSDVVRCNPQLGRTAGVGVMDRAGGWDLFC